MTGASNSDVDARPPRSGLATAALTAFALAAFAANSVLGRTALAGRLIDGPDYALIRLASGAALLLALQGGSRGGLRIRLDLVQPVMLFVYAAAFAFAYLSLSAGTGALILFAFVQLTMVLAAFRAGERFRWLEGVGLVLALAGFAWLVAPGVTAPSPAGSALMAAAGIAWGIYSIRGRGTADPLGDTARNFLLATPLALIVAALALRSLRVTPRGLALAAASGALTSGLGYVAWYAALRGLTAIRASIVQLAVPALAALGGVVFLAERITLRLVIAAVLILGGVAIAMSGRFRARR